MYSPFFYATLRNHICSDSTESHPDLVRLSLLVGCLPPSSFLVC